MKKQIIFVLKSTETYLVEALKGLVEFCVENDCACFVADGAHADATSLPVFENSPTSHPFLIVTLGGDGTLLRAVRRFYQYDAPFLGIKFGKLGFLTGARLEDAQEAIDGVLHETACVERRNLVQVKVIQNGACVTTEYALNEVVVGRVPGAPLVTTRLNINNHELYTSSGDGLIVSTSTGSTAYALSAGGPIMSPEYAGLVVVPLASHTLIQRAVVTAPHEIISIDFPDMARSFVELTFDGIIAQQYQHPDRVEVRAAEKDVALIKLDNRLFYETVASEFFHVQQED